MKQENEPLLQNNDLEEDVPLDSGMYEENKKFVKHSPFVTILLMTFGPLSTSATSFFEIIETLFISKGYQKTEPSIIQAIGYSSLPISTILFLCIYFGTSITARTSFLIGNGRRDDASHLISDIFRISFISTIIFMVGFYFLLKPFLKFTGCADELMDQALEYIYPMLFSTPLIMLAIIGNNYLQAIGRSGLSAIIQLSSSLVGSVLLAPLFIFVFKVKSKYEKISAVVPLGITGILLTILIFKGKFSIKVPLKYLIGKFTKETGTALSYSIPVIFQFLSLLLPPLFVLQGLNSIDKSQSATFGGAHNTYSKIQLFLISIPTAVSNGFLSAGSHAYGSRDYNRFFKMFFTTLAICIGFLAAFLVIVFAIPRQLSSMFLTDPEQIEFTKKFITISFSTTIVDAFVLPVAQFLLIIGKPYFTLISSLLQTVIICIGANIGSKYIKPEEAYRLMHIYNISDILNFVIYLVIFLVCYCILKKRTTEESIIKLKTEDMDYERID